MFCQGCGAKNEDTAVSCVACGQLLQSAVYLKPAETKHDVPKCTRCGYVGNWKLDSLLRPVDIVLGILFLFLGVIPGLVYLGVVMAVRSNKDRRAKICPQCKARNLWTFLY